MTCDEVLSYTVGSNDFLTTKVSLFHILSLKVVSLKFSASALKTLLSQSSTDYSRISTQNNCAKSLEVELKLRATQVPLP